MMKDDMLSPCDWFAEYSIVLGFTSAGMVQSMAGWAWQGSWR
jgi:hypothetical protein